MLKREKTIQSLQSLHKNKFKNYSKDSYIEIHELPFMKKIIYVLIQITKVVFHRVAKYLELCYLQKLIHILKNEINEKSI